MDYERENYMRGTNNADAQSIANMHQQQQQKKQELQHKTQQQQHAEQQKLHLQALQQQQPQHVAPITDLQHEHQQQQLHPQMQLLGHQQAQHPQIPIDFHHHFQQQQQHHHNYMLQQQFQQHQQQLQHHHFQQYQQQQQQQHQHQLHHHHHHHQQQQSQHQQLMQRSPKSQNETREVTLNQMQHHQQQQPEHLPNQQNLQQQQQHNQSDLTLIRHQEILHPPSLLQQQQPKQHQQPQMTPANPTTPNYASAHSTTKAAKEAHVASTTLQQQQQQQQSEQQNVDLRSKSSSNNHNNNDSTTVATSYSTIPQTTTLTTNTTPSLILPTSQHDLQHFGTSTQYNNRINTTNSYMSNNKTDNSLTSIPSSLATSSLMQPTSLAYTSINGVENAAAYNKFYQTYGQNQFFLPHHHHHQQHHQQQQQQQHQLTLQQLQQHQLPPLESIAAKSHQEPPPTAQTATTTTTTEMPLATTTNSINTNNYMDNTTITTAAATTEATSTTTTTTTATCTTLNGNYDCVSTENMKRKSDEADSEDTPDMKKLLEEKKNLAINNLRKNIRDVMDETQLDTTTLAAQREESERLARVAEQQKVMREYQRQTAVNRQYARTQNRVMSLLQSGKTYAKFTDSSPAVTSMTVPPPDLPPTTPQSAEADNSSSSHSQPLPPSVLLDIKPKISCTSKSQHLDIEDIETVGLDEDKSSQSTPHSTMDGEMETSTVGDVVTIEDSSSEDDCILLSDDDDLMDDEEEEADDPHNSGLHVQDNYNVADELGRVIINVGHPEGEEDIFVAPQIAKTIKPHQIGGVRFLFDNIIESTKRFKNSSGFGCILAHSMGLGKTLQVVCFCDIFLRHTNSKTVLCVMPINTLQNWVNEFNMWTPRHSNDPQNVRPRHFDVFVLNDQHKTLSARAKVILRWAEEGGVLLIGYELFRLLALKIMPTRRRRGQKPMATENTSSEAHKRLTENIYQALVKPGPDLVICDEGHRIKNSHAGISLALKQIRTRRRIVLTGYPLQNNLLEYWCMVDFVRPNYLGTRTEFCNMFERPIQNGQCIDSTPEDIKLMRYRAHVLHSLLIGFVQRRSHMVLQQTLPQKLEYVILTRMTSFQRQLYDTFMNDVVRTRTVPNPLKAFSVCCKIWNHPDVLYNFLKRYEHDLDIEIEEGEIVPEITPIADAGVSTSVAPISKINSSIANTTTVSSSTAVAVAAINGSVESTTENVATPTSNAVVPATFVEESQTSSSGFSSMNG